MKQILIKKENRFRKFIKTIFLFAFHKLENNSIGTNNGEKYTIEVIINSILKRKRQFLFFDIGANVGNYSKLIIATCQNHNVKYEGHLFEPVKDNFYLLKTNLGHNSSLHLNNFGISNVEKEVDIYLGSEHSSIDRFEMIGVYNKKVYKDVEKISVKRLDNYLKEKKIDKVDFLKIDTEGHEMKVLESLEEFLSDQKIDFIQFEYGDGHIFTKNFCRDFYIFFNKYNYHVYKIKPNYFEDREYNFYMENFKSTNYIAISKNKIIEITS